VADLIPTPRPGLAVAAFAGSLRAGSYNRALLRAAIETAPDGMAIEIVDIAAIPLYDADLEGAGIPEPVAALKRAIAAADGLLIATPEYNHGVPGVTKNAIDAGFPATPGVAVERQAGGDHGGLAGHDGNGARPEPALPGVRVHELLLHAAAGDPGGPGRREVRRRRPAHG
jgi:hypothetical protein